MPYLFTATAGPPDSNLPVTYVWEATGQAPITHPERPSLADSASFTWLTDGIQTITVTATNAGATVVDTHEILVSFGQISGAVRLADGIPLAGITVSAGAGHEATTDASGVYTLTGLLAGTYTLAPVTAGDWIPASRTVAVPPDRTGQDFSAHLLEKTVSLPAWQPAEFGDPLTYTLRLIAPLQMDLTLVDPVPMHTSYLTGSLSGPAGIVYDPVAEAISGTVALAAGVTTTVSFAVQVEVTGTIEGGPVISNEACLYWVGGDVVECGRAASYTVPRPVFLPVVFW
jgi:hypothetical protein